MINEEASPASWHKITLDGLGCCEKQSVDRVTNYVYFAGESWFLPELILSRFSVAFLWNSVKILICKPCCKTQLLTSEIGDRLALLLQMVYQTCFWLQHTFTHTHHTSKIPNNQQVWVRAPPEITFDLSIFKTLRLKGVVSIFTNPSARAGYDTRSI